MRPDDFFDLLGEIDDKYYLESMWEEEETVTMEPKPKRRFSAARIAASLAVIIGIAAAAGFLLHNKDVFAPEESENYTEQPSSEETSFDQNEYFAHTEITHYFDLTVTDLNRALSQAYELIKPTDEQIGVCANYVLENQDNGESEIAKSVYGPMEITDLSFYTVDLNFDNTEEIVIVSWDFSDLFIFELKGDEAVYNCTVPKNNIDFIITEENFTNIGPFYGDGVENKQDPGDAECYYHFCYEPENGLGELRIIAAGIKYEREKGTYRAAKLMEYGCKNTGKEEFDVWYSVSEEEFPDFGEMDEDKFELLWLRHEKLKYVIFERDIEHCKNYVIDNYDKYLPPDQRGYFTEPDYDNLTFYIKDLDLDGLDEIIIVDWDHSPLFIFTHSPESFVYSSMIGRDKIRAYLNEENFLTLAEYDDGEEKFCYYYVETEYAYSDISRIMIAIKPQRDVWVTYSTEYLLIYGMETRNSNDWTAFFRKGVGADQEELSYEEFNELWSKYKSLPPISFVDINNTILKWYETDRHQTMFDFSSYGYDFYSLGESYIIDENGGFTNLNGDVEIENGEEENISVDMYNLLKDGDLEYMGEVEHYHYGDIVSVSSGKAYQFMPPYVGPGSYLMIVWNPDPERTDVYSSVLLKRCLGYSYHNEEYPEFDINKIPDIPEAEEYISRRRHITDEQTAIYAAAYPCFAHSVLYSEEKYGYRFELIAEEVFKDTAAGLDKIYYNTDTYTRISKLADRGTMVIDYNTPFVGNNFIPISENFEKYALRVYELKDGIVMFCPSTDTGGYLTPFTTIVENEDGSIEIGYLYGDFGDIMLNSDVVEGYRYVDTSVRFTADYESNTLYYGGTAFVFDFSKVGRGFEFDEELGYEVPVECFTAVKVGD